MCKQVQTDNQTQPDALSTVFAGGNMTASRALLKWIKIHRSLITGLVKYPKGSEAQLLGCHAHLIRPTILIVK